MTTTPIKLLTFAEVSELVGIPVATLRDYRFKGVGPRSAKVGGRVMYREADVLAWIDEQFDGASDAGDEHSNAGADKALYGEPDDLRTLVVSIVRDELARHASNLRAHSGKSLLDDLAEIDSKFGLDQFEAHVDDLHSTDG